MNRFRTRRKAKEEAAAAAKAAPPTPEPSNPFRLFKGKKSHEEPVEEKIDIANALPATDDFRTSLLMTGLSARFSMLREQDDPNTKIGKASDDSVLFPKRQSRIQDIAFRGLGDIAEVESIRAPPSLTRINSYNSASDADSGSMSVMDRARPTEGNVLFGGRQKIYKVSPAGSTSGGGLGKPLYEDDVSMSSFQRWKLAEKEKQAHEDQDSTDIATPLSRASDLEALRPESPSTYNKKRETGSTTSSAPSASRNSTAATSITSQKDFHHPGSSATSPTPIMEKTVARTRRLYEQGLTQDLQNQQSHALSRIDTLARKTPGRLPDISQNISSTAHLFGDRVVDRRLLSKGSAPNMQPSSPLTAPRSSTSTAASPVDAGFRATGSHETKPFGASPPLSPPISEHEEHPTLPIQASDKGKATAMGVFQKPAQPYDESRFAQRQIQMQQGRETPTGMSRTDSDASRGAQRSPSPVAPQAAVSRPRVAPADATTPEVLQRSTMTFFDDDAEDSLPPMPHSRIPTRQAGPVRPADEDHPAFRSSALPTPLSVTSPMFDEEENALPITPNTSVPSMDADPKDSPTLGPPAGLSGMVRQHLRSDSGASSVYGADPQVPAHNTERTSRAFDSKALDDLVSDLNPWATQDQEWTASFYGGNADASREDLEPSPAKPQEQTPVANASSSRQSTTSSDAGKETDVFHSQLADGARRIRERLTSYVETDSARNSYDAPSTPESTSRPNPLAGLLRKQSSRGSLIEKPREVNNPSKTIKLLGLSNSTMSSSVSPNKPAFEKEDPPLSPMPEEPASPVRHSPEKSSSEQEKEDPAHAALRQFRQARRELQKLKETETRQRHQQAVAESPGGFNDNSPTDRGAAPRSQSRPGRVRSPSRDRRPPPVSYSRAPSTEPWAGPGSNPGSRGPSRAGSRPPSSNERENERDRSGSEASNGGRAHSRPPPRPRNGPHDEYQHSPQHGGRPPHGARHGPQHGPPQGSPHAPQHAPPPPPGGRQPPMIRSPGHPGPDMRRPQMPSPQPFPGMASAGHSDRSGPGLSTYQPQRGLVSGQPSPISPMGDLPSPFLPSGRSTPNGAAPSPRRPSAPPQPPLDLGSSTTTRLDSSMKRVVRKQDISDPTFISSTSRVPTVNLPEDIGMRSRSGSGTRSRSGSLLPNNPATASTPNLYSLQHSQANAPPLPPINPRRRNNGPGGFMGRKGEEDMGLESPQPPFAPNGMDSGDENRSAFSMSDEEEMARERRRLRKAPSEANVGARSRSGTLRSSPPYFAGGQHTPPGGHVAPTVRSNGLPGGLI